MKHLTTLHSRGYMRRQLLFGALLGAAILLGGCDFLFGTGETAPTPAAVQVRKAVPTFTPTADLAVVPLAAPARSATVTVSVQSQVAQATTAAASQPATQSMTTTTTAILTPTAVATTGPQLTVNDAVINIRSGPGTDFALVGTASQGQTFQVIAKNAQSDWWQICCLNGQQGWIFGQLASVQNVDNVAVAADLPTPAAPTATPAPVAAAPTVTPTVAAQPTPPPAANDDSAGNFDPNAAYQIVHYKVLGKDENNGGIRDSRAQHLIFITVLDANGNGVDGAVVQNLVGDHSQIVTGGKGPGKAEITMYYDPFKLTVASDPSGPTTSQVSNQMGLAFPHLPDLVGKLGGTDYEYAVCPTLEINCQWPIHAVHYSYEITFQKKK